VNPCGAQRITLLGAVAAQFYPFFTTGQSQGSCVWQEGGNFIPGTTNHFGGSSCARVRRALRTVYPEAGFTTQALIDNFNAKPCPEGLLGG
jgi:hypothetical protein